MTTEIGRLAGLICACFAAACAGGQTGTPGSFHGGGDPDDACPDSADAGTALGVSTADLWHAYSGTTTATVRRLRPTRLSIATLPPVEVTITIEPSDEPLPHTVDCSSVVAAVRITLESEAAELEEHLLGELTWSDERPYVVFDTFVVGEDTYPRVNGTMYFGPGGTRMINFTVYRSESDWYTFTNEGAAAP